MTSTAQRTGRRPSGHAVLLLVFVVLAGVLAMHGLGPSGAPASHSAHDTAAPSTGAVQSTAHSSDQNAAPGDPMTPAPVTTPTPRAPHTIHCVEATAGDGGSGHLRHADMTCAASGVSTSYASPALAPAHGDPATVPLGAGGRVAAATGGDRAPPDLAQLQLLRI
ncbi:DUF6153 family protein [Streptomyces sp. NPDC093252]|uniref:DUF6153 family protein n=1 Tax=Streptomyces sp. NPDC093252 TaxID=3154980 RepID=UPI003418C571